LTAVLDRGPAFADAFRLDSNGSVSYTHDGSETKSDSFTYFACDDGSDDDDDDDDAKCDKATVRITVNPVNDPPTAADDTATVQEDSKSNSIKVTDNDFDPEGGKLTVVDASASVGSAAPNNDNVLYTPSPGFSGEARIDYTISDNDGGTDSAVLRVRVSENNDAPVARDQSVSTDAGTPVAITLTATDEDGQLDIVFVNASGLHQTWKGSGTDFALHAEQIIDIGATTGILAELGFADTDDPGCPDLALGGAGCGYRRVPERRRRQSRLRRRGSAGDYAEWRSIRNRSRQQRLHRCRRDSVGQYRWGHRAGSDQ
jgi:hypothetical protein